MNSLTTIRRLLQQICRHSCSHWRSRSLHDYHFNIILSVYLKDLFIHIRWSESNEDPTINASISTSWCVQLMR